MYIDGRWTEASGGVTYEIVNPATEAVIARAPSASEGDLDRAIAAARKAFDEGPWPRTTPHDRARVIRRLIDALERRREEIRQLLITMAAAEYVTHGIQLDTPFQLLANYAEIATSFQFE